MLAALHSGDRLARRKRFAYANNFGQLMNGEFVSGKNFPSELEASVDYKNGIFA